MPTADVVEPEGYEDDELPSNFLIFTCPDLDQNEDKAREASEEIQDILCDIVDSVCDLEDIERALREAEATSSRAQRAREQLLSALRQTDSLVPGVGNAQDAFAVR